MPDLSRLETLIGRLAEKDFSRANEAATCEIAVLPVIGALGWDTDDFDEVRRQYQVKDISGEKGLVDYCLCARERPRVLIEAKPAQAELSRHQAQLLRYAYQEGVELAALTNGLDWWLYLPMVGGEQAHNRLFSSIDLRERAHSDSAATLHRFLNRNSVLGGEAKSEAEREFENQKRNRLVKSAVPEAWRHVDGDSRLQGLLAEFARTVEERSGHSPDREMIARFLQDRLASIGGEGGSSALGAMQTAADRQPREAGTQGTAQSPKLGRRSPKAKRDANKPEAFWLDGVRYELKEQKERRMLVQLCEHLAKETGDIFVERVSKIRGRERALFSSSPDDLRDPLSISGTPLYVEGNISGPRAERIARQTLRTVRGSDEGFRVERAEPPPSP